MLPIANSKQLSGTNRRDTILRIVGVSTPVLLTGMRGSAHKGGWRSPSLISFAATRAVADLFRI